ncbi:PstS family phosphate ABC transporter substrate-binding protein [bacterium]|nr:PstS family phosphate ABC transporter substrate-binding protein [bacterium]
MKLTKVILALVAILAIAMFVGCNNQNQEQTGSTLEGKITMSGSTTVLPIAQACAEEFMNQNPKVNISVRGGGSSIGIKDIMAGTVEIGNASRDAKGKEINKAKESGIDLYQNVVANDGIAIIVNPKNTITNLTLEQIQAIYTGKYTNWNELGGPDMNIVLISRDTSSGTYEVFYEIAMKKQNIVQNCIMVASNNAAVTSVKDTPGAISYAGLGYLSSSVKPVQVNGVDPTMANVLSGKYAVARKLNMYTNGAPQGITKTFIDFILSDEGQKIVEKQGFIKVK